MPCDLWFTASPSIPVHAPFEVHGYSFRIGGSVRDVLSEALDGWTWLFMVTTLLTSVTGFFFPFHRILRSHILGVLSVIALAIAVYARYSRRLDGAWRSAYVMSAAIALHLNVFVWIAQLFPKVPSLKALAPTQSEPPFQVTQLIVMVIFITLSAFAVEGFRPDLARAT